MLVNLLVIRVAKIFQFSTSRNTSLKYWKKLQDIFRTMGGSNLHTVTRPVNTKIPLFGNLKILKIGRSNFISVVFNQLVYESSARFMENCNYLGKDDQEVMTKKYLII